jgi:hypothetical protein
VAKNVSAMPKNTSTAEAVQRRVEAVCKPVRMPVAAFSEDRGGKVPPSCSLHEGPCSTMGTNWPSALASKLVRQHQAWSVAIRTTSLESLAFVPPIGKPPRAKVSLRPVPSMLLGPVDQIDIRSPNRGEAEAIRPQRPLNAQREIVMSEQRQLNAKITRWKETTAITGFLAVLSLVGGNARAQDATFNAGRSLAPRFRALILSRW